MRDLSASLFITLIPSSIPIHTQWKISTPTCSFPTKKSPCRRKEYSRTVVNTVPYRHLPHRLSAPRRKRRSRKMRTNTKTSCHLLRKPLLPMIQRLRWRKTMARRRPSKRKSSTSMWYFMVCDFLCVEVSDREVNKKSHLFSSALVGVGPKGGVPRQAPSGLVFSCRYCGVGYHWASNIRRHCLKHHKSEYEEANRKGARFQFTDSLNGVK